MTVGPEPLPDSWQRPVRCLGLQTTCPLLDETQAKAISNIAALRNSPLTNIYLVNYLLTLLNAPPVQELETSPKLKPGFQAAAFGQINSGRRELIKPIISLGQQFNHLHFFANKITSIASTRPSVTLAILDLISI